MRTISTAVIAAVALLAFAGTAQAQTGACCDGVTLACTETTEATCLGGSGTYLGDGTTCTPDDPCDCNNNGILDSDDLQPSGAAGSDMGESFPGSVIDSTMPDAVDTIVLGSADFVADVNLEVDITHTFLADLEIDIEHLGTTVRVMDDDCGGFDNMMIVFDDQAATSIQGLTCANNQAGTFRPQNPLSAFNGLAAGGNWTLTVNDDAGGDVGTLDRWKVIVATLDTAPFSQDANGNGVPDECDPAGACCLPTGMCAGVADQNECEVTLGGIYQGDGTLCQFVSCPQPCTTCNTPVNSYPYTEDFEIGLGLWTQNTNDNGNWTRDSAGTPSTGTGPSVDHTLGTAAGFYMFTEATGPAPGARFILDGPCFDLAGLTNPAFSFWYHMLGGAGTAMGTLSVEVSDDNCLSYTEVFSQSGNQGNVWIFEQIDLAAYAGQQVNIRFIGTRGTDFTSDMAIDDIGVGEGQSITGACCAIDGSCSELEEADCLTAGGTYAGDLTTCAGVDCTGACCLNESCEVASETSCNNAGGVYLGGGSVCGVDPCPPSNDTCATATVVTCGTGTITGLTVDAANADHTLVSAGSCTGFDADGPEIVFSFTAPDDLEISAGMINVVGFDATFYVVTDCSNTNATCVAGDDSGGAEEVTFNAIGGTTYFMITDSWTDAPAPGTSFDFYISCAALPTGRCCEADGTCTIVDAADCTNLGGTYGGDGTDCTESCFGACCLPANGGCVSETQVSCTNAGGTYGGDATACFTYDIGTGTSNGGIICRGSCTDLTILRSSPAQAASIDITFDNNIATQDGLSGSCGAGGALNMHNDAIFRYLAISPTSGPCDVTITVTPTGYDAVLVVRSACDGAELACADVGATGGAESVTIPNYGPGNLFIQVGDFGATEGGGPTQLQVDCSTATGACCIGGGCQILTAGNCLLAGGIYKGAGTDCASSCFGACCAANGTCASVTESSCTASAGTYQGDGTGCAPNPCPQPPANDACIDAIEVFTGANNGGNNCLASTVDDAEASCQANSGKDVWFFWTATCTGNATIDTEGSVFTTSNDTVLSVYDSCGGAELACDDDAGSGLLSTVTLAVTQGVDYYIRVAGFSANCGDITLNISCLALCGTCPGDMNGDSLLDGLDIQTFTNCYLAEFGTNPSAACKCADINEDNTLDPSDITLFVDLLLNGGGVCNPGACCYLDGGSAACVVTDAAGCTSLGGNFTLGADCSGDPCPAGRCCSNGGLNCADIPQVECTALGGSWSAGLTCAGSPCPITPPNDGCGGAIVAFDGATPVNLTNATSSGLAACGDFPFGGPTNQQVNNDLWYEYVASCTGTLFVDTCGSTFDSRLAVYDVDCAAILGGALPVECNDDHGNATEADTGNTCAQGLAASLSIPVTSGNTYLVRVGSFSTAAQTAMFNLNIACVAGGSGACCITATGACVDVTGGDTECMGLGGTYNGDGTSCATTICGGACCLANGTCVDAATGSDCVDNIGGAYQGNGTECASTSCPQPPPANDDCANATVVVTGTNAGGNNCGTVNPDENEASCQASSDHDVYYIWTADCTGQATIDTETSVFAPSNDTVLTVYETSCGGVEIACDDDDGTGLLSTVSFACTLGTDYVIRVAGFGATNCGSITLNIACASGGACCLPNTTCVAAADANDCTVNLGGVYQGDFTDCGSIICGGACCLANGTCTQAVDSTDCLVNLGGTNYYGDGTQCSDPFVVCPGPGECLHTITLFDTFGDGWIGNLGPDAAIEVFVNGVSAFGGPITLPDQGQVNVPVQGSANFVAATGDVITTTYFPADTFNDENSWEITDGGAVVICNDPGGATGPDATVMRACPSTGNCP